MSYEKPIPLPRFALPMFYTKNPCRFCKTIIREHDLHFAGVGRGKDGNLCFAFEYRCPTCGQFLTVVDTEHPFTQHDWWEEIVERHKAAQHFEYVSYFASKAWWDLPKIGPMKISDEHPGPVWIRGGYKGEVGPVILLYEGTKGNLRGAMRLERRHRVSLLSDEDDVGLPWMKNTAFAQVKDGATFTIEGRNWIKMSAGEIEEIIREQVFDVLRDPNDPVTTPVVKNRRGHGNALPKKSSNSTRRPPRNSGTVDS
jgi:hypothetical protein